MSSAYYIFIFIHQAIGNVNSNNNRKLNYKHLMKHYNLLQNWQKPFTVEVYRDINLCCLFKITARQINNKAALTIFYYINYVEEPFRRFWGHFDPPPLNRNWYQRHPTETSLKVKCRSTVGGRAFPVAGAKVCNGLQSDVTSASWLSVFRNRLKTYLFRLCYETVWLWMTFPFPSHYLPSRTVVLAIVFTV